MFACEKCAKKAERVWYIITKPKLAPVITMAKIVKDNLNIFSTGWCLNPLVTSTFRSLW